MDRLVGDSGAVSADWMALSAGAMLMILVVIGNLREGSASLATSTEAAMQSAAVTPIGTLGYAD